MTQSWRAEGRYGVPLERVKRRKRRSLVGGSALQADRDTVKLREVPKAHATKQPPKGRLWPG